MLNKQISHFFLLFLIIVVFLFGAGTATAKLNGKLDASGRMTESIVVLDSEVEKVALGSIIGILEDPSGELSVEDVASAQYVTQFSPVDDEVPSFGFTSSAYWAHIKLRSILPEKSEWVLEVPYAALDLIEIYQLHSDGSYIVQKAGDSVDFSLRDIKYPTMAFYVQLPPSEVQNVYLRIKTTSSMQLPVVLWSTKAFINSSSKTLLFWGVYFGILLIAASYNLFLFFSIRDRVFLYYVLFVASLTLMQLTLNGFSVQYLWPHRPEFSNVALLISLNLTVIFAALFSKSFLKLNQHAPLLSKGLTMLAAIMVVDLLLAFVAPYSMVLRVYIAGLIFGGPLFILSGIVCWKNGFLPARIYLIAWLIFVGGGIAYALKTWGYLPATPLSNYALPIGSAFEVVLFSIALGLRVNLQQKETNAARKAMLNMQIELSEANKGALKNSQASDRLKQEFLATMSHELRTPMNGILGCCQLLEDLDLSPEDKSTMRSLTDSADQMMIHVNRILNFSQLNEGKLSIDYSSINLDDIVSSLTSTFYASCKAKGLHFFVNINADTSKNLIGDQQKILHVLKDLVDNAVKFTSQGTVEVSISTVSKAPKSDENVQQIKFSVRDTGIGVDKESKKKIFAMFSQKDGSFNRSNEGLGLGLAICKKYVELMGGEIHFNSDPGVGTSVELAIPVKVSKSPRKASHEDAGPHYENLSAHILVVEDNLTNQLIMEGMLKRMGHSVKIAKNGVEALKLLEKEVFEIIFMDCQMPVMDGFETTTRIRSKEEAYNKIPIIAVTANAMAGDREHCLEVGMSDYLSKPVSKNSLKEKLDNWRATGCEQHQLPHPQT